MFTFMAKRKVLSVEYKFAIDAPSVAGFNGGPILYKDDNSCNENFN